MSEPMSDERWAFFNDPEQVWSQQDDELIDEIRRLRGELVKYAACQAAAELASGMLEAEVERLKEVVNEWRQASQDHKDRLAAYEKAMEGWDGYNGDNICAELRAQLEKK